MSWTPEREEKLRQLWKKGHSGSQIASILGNTTRNAVIGKVFRLKLASRITSKKLEGKKSTEKNNSPETKTQRLGRKARFKALLLDRNLDSSAINLLPKNTNNLNNSFGNTAFNNDKNNKQTEVKETVNIYPNPNDGSMWIEYSLENAGAIVFYNMAALHESCRKEEHSRRAQAG